MERRPLGTTGLEVSVLSLGTMTFGQQNTEAEAHAQLDRAVARGVNFLDTAEMYPVPPQAETQGRTEAYIGSWLRERKSREGLVIASKVTGRSRNFGYLERGDETRLNAAHIRPAVEGSLRRLGIDTLDLYYTHWPERNVNIFGILGFPAHVPETDPVPLLETMQVMAELIREGKIRHWAVSNDTPWGVMTALHLADKHGLPRPQAVQNPYSLLNRSYDIGLAEVSWREQVGLCAYSVLGMGMLTGKYRHGARPADARLTLFDRFRRYSGSEAVAAAEACCTLAERHGLTPTALALAFVRQQPYVTSIILGATNLAQLDENLDSADVVLSPDVLAEVEALFRRFPCPAP